MMVVLKFLSRVWLFVTTGTVAHQAPLSMQFSRQDYWSGLPFPSPGDLPHPGVKPRSPALQADSSPSESPGKPVWKRMKLKAEYSWKWDIKWQVILFPFRKGRGTRDQIANIHRIIEKTREFQKNIYFCLIDYAKAFDCVDHNKLWKILKEMGIPNHLTCLLRNLYAGQEATVRTEHGTTDWFQIGKGVCQGCILSPCLFSLYAEDIMRNAGLEEAQAGIKIARRNINNLRYADGEGNGTPLQYSCLENSMDRGA